MEEFQSLVWFCVFNMTAFLVNAMMMFHKSELFISKSLVKGWLLVLTELVFTKPNSAEPLPLKQRTLYSIIPFKV